MPVGHVVANADAPDRCPCFPIIQAEDLRKSCMWSAKTGPRSTCRAPVRSLERGRSDCRNQTCPAFRTDKTSLGTKCSSLGVVAARTIVMTGVTRPTQWH